MSDNESGCDNNELNEPINVGKTTFTSFFLVEKRDIGANTPNNYAIADRLAQLYLAASVIYFYILFVYVYFIK